MMNVESCAAGLPPDAAEAAVVIDLDDVDECPASVVAAASSAMDRHPGVVVGVARQPLSQTARLLAQHCTTTVASVDVAAVGVTVDDVEAAVERLAQVATSLPARILGQLLRMTSSLPRHDALVAESLAYSTLLGGRDFRAWRDATPVRDRTPSRGAIRVDRDGDLVKVVLSRPQRRNALDATARRDLVEALDVVANDPRTRLELSGEGPCFCSGGDLDEFGIATDLAAAHALRIEHGPAPRLAMVADRTTASVHGPCVGAGVELAAFATEVVARRGTSFRLPELAMGLIPGAGGTVSLPRRIGRWRAAWLMLTGDVLELDRAVAWGLVDRVE